MAALTSLARGGFSIPLVFALLGVLGVLAASTASPLALAAGPTQAPTAGPPTCTERFPAEGPAGVDLRLGCIFGEVVGVYSTAAAAPPTPLSSYAITIGILLAAGLVAVWFVGRLLARRAGERLAPVMPGEWWACASCRSVNGGGVQRCYSCGAGRPEGPAMVTDEQPITTQSFGRRRKNG